MVVSSKPAIGALARLELLQLGRSVGSADGTFAIRGGGNASRRIVTFTIAGVPPSHPICNNSILYSNSADAFTS